MISVILPIYKERIEWVRLSVDSILNQTYRNFELLLINDDPDSTENINLIRYYEIKDIRVRGIFHEKNIGLPRTLNLAIQEAKGEYIARMDADDIALPERLQYQYDYMEEHPEIDVCGTWAFLFGDISAFSNKKLRAPKSNTLIQIQALMYNPMIHPSVMFRMERLPRTLYNEKYLKAQDYALWGELIKKGYVLNNIPHYLMKYRITVKSAKKSYRTQQYTTADSIRAILLKDILSNCREADILLHNKICNEQTCDLEEAEEWLLRFRGTLTEHYPNNEKEISALISRLWINICLTNNARLNNYRKSVLSKRITFSDYLRFAKRGLVF